MFSNGQQRLTGRVWFGHHWSEVKSASPLQGAQVNWVRLVFEERRGPQQFVTS